MLRNRGLIILFGGLILLTSGCGAGKPVQVVVTLDGKPVEGANVVLMAEGAAGQAISGFTSADGSATLTTSSKEGIKPGTYKVLVTKVKTVTVGTLDPKSPEAMKMMTGKGPKPKSELPLVYGSMTTPITITVPVAASPVKIELKAKP